MRWFVAIVIGLVAGVGVGQAALMLRLSPVIQSVLAAFVGFLVSGGLTIFTVLHYFPPPGQTLYFGIGTDTFIWMAVTLAAGGFLHVALGVVSDPGGWIHAHRALILSVAGGLWGALPVVWAVDILSRIEG